MVCFIVEGQTDKALIENILSTLKINKGFKFVGLKGDGSVTKYIKHLTEHELSEHTYFAIIDADKSFNDREEEMKECIGNKEVEFFIMPNNKNKGELEDLILPIIGDKDEVIKCFTTYAKCIKDKINKDVENKHKLYAYTTLQLDKRPEEYIKSLDIGDDFKILEETIKNLL